MKRIKPPVLDQNRTRNNDKLHTFQRSVRKQGVLAICTILLTAILIFAMTTAWYTNVAQTSGLIFETATWGFTGKIEVGDQAIQAVPGMYGLVPITVTNQSDENISLDIMVAKTQPQMSEELQKRIYFYVDTAMQQNGEMMERVYLSKANGYTYHLGSRGQLTLTEETCDDAPVYWEWVYDMLGYYVQGKLDSNNSVKVEEYLRPIVYDYNAATFGTDGKLQTVDGETGVAEFLTEISASDGYMGTIDATESVGGYYPVSVGEDGCGVWAYLCTVSEIERGIDFDTAFVQGTSENRSFTATVKITAQNRPSNEVRVDSTEKLLEALNNPSIDVIKLDQDIELTDSLILSDGSTVLDLNGHTISASNGTLFHVSSDASLSLKNGIIQGSGSDSRQEAIRAVGAVVTMNEMTVQDVGYAVVVTDNLGDGDSRINIKNSKFTTTQTAVLLQGNGPASAAKSQLIVENSTISSRYIGICGQGSATGTKQYWGTDIQIIHSVIEGYWAGIYHPQQQSVMTIRDGSKISGYTGIAVKGGDVTIIDSTVEGTGASQKPAAASSGFADTGDGVYVEANYPWAANVVIKGDSTVNSKDGKAVQLFQTDDGGPGSIQIYSGEFSSDVTEFWVTQES